MIGRSPIMQGLFDQIRRYAPHLRTALVSGGGDREGTALRGALRAVGPRRDRPVP